MKSVWLKTCVMSRDWTDPNLLARTGHKEGGAMALLACMFQGSLLLPHFSPPQREPRPWENFKPRGLATAAHHGPGLCFMEQDFPRLQTDCLNVLACVILNVHITSRIEHEPKETKGDPLTLSFQFCFCKKSYLVFLTRNLLCCLQF